MIGKQQFTRAADKAAKVGSIERRMIAQRLAADLEYDPWNFDPEKLIALGDAGLRHFVASIGADVASLSSAPRIEHQPENERPPQDWADMRKHEIGFFWRAVLTGVGMGVGMICAAVLIRQFSL